MDYLLQTQDLNQDGLLAPSELLSQSKMKHQESNIAPDPPADEALKQEETEKKPEDGDSKNHQIDAEVNQESEHKNETQNPDKEHHKQTPEKAEEQQDHQQPPEEQKLQDDHQELENTLVHQEQPKYTETKLKL